MARPGNERTSRLPGRMGAGPASRRDQLLLPASPQARPAPHGARRTAYPEGRWGMRHGRRRWSRRPRNRSVELDALHAAVSPEAGAASTAPQHLLRGSPPGLLQATFRWPLGSPRTSHVGGPGECVSMIRSFGHSLRQPPGPSGPCYPSYPSYPLDSLVLASSLDFLTPLLILPGMRIGL